MSSLKNPTHEAQRSRLRLKTGTEVELDLINGGFRDRAWINPWLRSRP